MSAVKTRILNRIDIETNWNNVNPVLSSGEIAFVQTDNGTFMKVGNGSNYLDTPFFSNVKIDENIVPKLEVVHISQEDYHNLVSTNKINDSTLYIVSSDVLNLYGEKIINVSTPENDTDAANKKYVDDLSVNLKNDIKIPTKTSELTNDSDFTTATELNKVKTATTNLSNELKTKSSVVIDGIKTDLSVVHISKDEYHELVVNENIDNSTLYIISSENINAYGERITNLADGISENDAATYGQLSNLQHYHDTTITDVQVIKPEFKHRSVHMSLSVFSDSNLTELLTTVNSNSSAYYFMGYTNDGEKQSWKSTLSGFGTEYDNYPILIQLTKILEDNDLSHKYSQLFLLYEWYYYEDSTYHASDRYSVAIPSYTEVGANASDYVSKTQYDELQTEILKPSQVVVETDDMFVCYSNKTNNITDVIDGTVQILLDDFSFEKQYDIKFTTGNEGVTFEFNTNDLINGPEYDETWNINKNYRFEANNTYLIKIRQDFIEVVENQYLGGSVKGNLLYKLVMAQPVDVNSTIFNIENRTITTITLSDSNKDITINLPEKQDGYARDFILRIEVTSSIAPQIIFNGLDEDWLVDSEDEEWMMVKPGTNVISFTEMIQGK